MNHNEDYFGLDIKNNIDSFGIAECNCANKNRIDEIDKLYELLAFVQCTKDENIGEAYIFIMLFFIAFGDNKALFQEKLLSNIELSKEFRYELKRIYEQIPEWMIEYFHHLLDDIE